MRLSTFDGEPEVREHYDADGNLTGTTLIPGWSDEDRAWALGLALREADQCPRGHQLSDSLDTDSWRWTVPAPAVCNACLVLDAAMSGYEKDPRRRAMLYTVHKHPRPKRND